MDSKKFLRSIQQGRKPSLHLCLTCIPNIFLKNIVILRDLKISCRIFECVTESILFPPSRVFQLFARYHIDNIFVRRIWGTTIARAKRKYTHQNFLETFSDLPNIQMPDPKCAVI